VSHTNTLSGKIASLNDMQAAIGEKGVEEELSKEEFVELHGISSDIHSLSWLNTSICWQQSRLTWLREGDANSKYFHYVLSCRRRRNSLGSILVSALVVEGVQPVCQTVFSLFACHFQAHYMVRPTVDDFLFWGLSYDEGGGLLKPFSIEEVKTAIWDCDSF